MELSELVAYASELAQRPQIVVANKCDMPGVEDAVALLGEEARKDGHPFFAVSAVTGKGLEELVTETAKQVSTLRQQIEVEAPLVDVSAEVEHRRQRRDRSITIKMESRGIWRVSGGAIERMVIQTDWENDEAVAYLQHRFERIGLDNKLAAEGCVPGDEVRILGYAFSFDGPEQEDEFAELVDDDDEDVALDVTVVDLDESSDAAQDSDSKGDE